jgi:hypothetical protein
MAAICFIMKEELQEMAKALRTVADKMEGIAFKVDAGKMTIEPANAFRDMREFFTQLSDLPNLTDEFEGSLFGHTDDLPPTQPVDFGDIPQAQTTSHHEDEDDPTQPQDDNKRPYPTTDEPKGPEDKRSRTDK